MTAGHPTPVPRFAPTGGDALLVAVGGAAGATVRWAVLTSAEASGAFPWPTLVVNLAGCLVVGLLTRSPRSVAMLAGVGFAGGLTTFSTFAVEVASLMEDSSAVTATAYLVASVVGGIVAVLVGRRLVERW